MIFETSSKVINLDQTTINKDRTDLEEKLDNKLPNLDLFSPMGQKKDQNIGDDFLNQSKSLKTTPTISKTAIYAVPA